MMPWSLLILKQLKMQKNASNQKNCKRVLRFLMRVAIPCLASDVLGFLFVFSNDS